MLKFPKILGEINVKNLFKSSIFLLSILAFNAFAVPAYTTVIVQYNESESQQSRLIYKPSEDSFLFYNTATNGIGWSALSNVTMASSQISDSTAVGRSVMSASNQADARAAIGAGTSSFSGAYPDLSGKPTNLNQFTNGPGYVTATTAPVTSVNSKTGSVTLTYTDVGAAALSHTHTASAISDSTSVGRSLVTAADQAAVKTIVGVPTAVSQLTNDSVFITSSALSPYATTSAMNSALAGKCNNPGGTTSQYMRGDCTLATFPTIPTAPVFYSGTTNGSGIYTVTYGSAYATKPKVFFSVEGGTNKDSAILTSTTTGFSVLVERRTDVLGLLPSYAIVSGLTVNVSVNPN